MKIALCSSFVPFIFGGARFIVEWLEEKLIEHGHQVERIYLPFVEDREAMFGQMMAYRLMDLSESVDRLIAFRPPAYVIPHPNKVLWFIHHIRVYYDLWDSIYRPVPDSPPGRALRHRLFAADRTALLEARHIFTNSKVVSDRLQRFNNLNSEVLYPPILKPERFRCDEYGDEIVYVCRVEHHKRQHLLVEAMSHTRTPVKLRLCGTGMDPGYTERIAAMIGQFGLRDRVFFDNRWISEAEKSDVLATALAAVYAPLDEDSYGYPSLEACHARKPILTTTDSGGVTELVIDGINGFVSEPNPKALAEAMDRLYSDRPHTTAMGAAAESRIAVMNITWDHVVDKLLS